ncbi:MAG: hypothetical protein AAF570_00015 [Bacteroidota bacterium]
MEHDSEMSIEAMKLALVEHVLSLETLEEVQEFEAMMNAVLAGTEYDPKNRKDDSEE